MLLNGRFRCTRLLKGGQGVDTYLAEDLEADGALVVVKLLHADEVAPAMYIRLEHEAAVLSKLQGDGFQPLLNYFADGDHLYLVQPFLAGQTLAERLTDGPLSVPSTLTLAANVLRALQHAHDLGVLHRDIKPANIIVQGTEPLERAHLIDFGLSRTTSLDPTLRHEAVGTARYLAPEQAGLVASAIDERSDLYSLGVVLYECVAGKPPFTGASVGEVFRQHLSLPVPDLSTTGTTAPRALEAVVHRLLGKEPGQRYQSAGGALADVESIALALSQGVAEPQVVIGLHDRRSMLVEPAFVGRRAELAVLASHLDQAREGAGGLVAIEAESGGGKTRLLDELAGRAFPLATWIVRGNGVDQAAQRPYQVLEGVADAIVAAAADDPAVAVQLRDRLGDKAEAVAVALPELNEVLGRVKPDELPEAHGEARSLAALTVLIDALGTPTRPALVLLDDCQWADGLTAQLLTRWQQYASEAGSHVLVVAAFRSEEVRPDHLLRRMKPRATLSLEPLGLAEIGDVARSMAGPLPADVVATVAQLSEGSPFMATAVLRGLVECGALVKSAEGWRVEKDTLTDISTSRRAALFLVRRLKLLSPAALQLLSVGAVLGKDFDLVLAIDLAGLEPAQAVPALNEARRRRIVWMDEPRGRCQFLHDKLRETLLDNLATDERSELHRRAALRIEQLDSGRIFELAYHFDAAGAGGRALPYAIAAAEHARRQHTAEIAEAHYRMAVRVVDGTDRARRLLVAEGLGDILTLRGAYEEAAAQFELALELATGPVARATLQGKLGDVAFKCGNVGAARQSLEAALRRLKCRVPRTGLGLTVALFKEVMVQALHSVLPRLFVGRRPPAGADAELLAIRLYSRLAYVYWFHSGRLRCGWAHLREMNLAERYPPTLELAQAYSNHGPVMTMVPWFTRGLTYVQRSLAIRTDLGDVWGQGQSLNFYGLSLYASSRYREAIEKCARAVQLLERTGDRWEENTGGWNTVFALYRLGELVPAVEEAKRVHRAALEIGDQAAAGIALSGWSRAAEGDVPRELVHAQLDRRDEDASTSVEVHLAEAVRLLGAGQPGEAAEVLRRAHAIVRGAGLRQEYVAPVLPWLATALRQQIEARPPYSTLAHRRLLRQARRTARRASRLARSYTNNRPHALREQGLLAALDGRFWRARRFLTTSLAVARAQGARFEEAQTLVARGRVGAGLGWRSAEEDLASGERLLALVRGLPAEAGAGTETGAETETEEEPTLSLADRFTTLIEVGRAIASASAPEAVYEAVRQAAGTVLRAEHCHVLKLGADGQASAFTDSGEVVHHISRTLILRALAAGAPVVSNLADGMDATESLVLSGARSVLCAPIACKGEPTACFYVTHAQVGGLFAAEEVHFAYFIATLAGAALDHVAGSEARFRSLAQNSSDVITIVDPAGVITYQSSSVERVFGFEPSELTGTRLADWIHPEEAAAATAAVDNALHRGDTNVLLGCRLASHDGSWRYTETTLTNLVHDPTVRGAVLNTRDVSERKALEAELALRASHDPLTGLPNRALFTDRVEHALARAQRTGTTTAVLFLDLDDFKSVNDSMGHGAGDLLLQGVAERFSGCMRPGDTVARFGGDEFAVLLEAASLEDAVRVGDRIVAELVRPFILRDREVHVHVSVGVAAGWSRAGTAEELLSNADAAMYVAKARGKDRLEVFVPAMRAGAIERSTLRGDLQSALEHDEFEVYYQPIVAVGTGRMVGAEALLRWHHPRRGLLSPAEFIPLAEESGLIVPVGSWVLHQACRQAQSWGASHPEAAEVSVSVNLSARQLQHEDLVGDVAAALEESGLAPSRLTLEITESAMVEDTDATIQRLHKLKGLGLKLSIDDFGTGYSSLSYLRRFRVDTIKIDRSFVTGVAVGNQDSAIITGIASMAHALGLEVVAEGVESLIQLEILTTLGCDMAQGYNWTPPVGAGELGRWLRCATDAVVESPRQLRVLLVDDQAHVRAAIGVVLGASDGYRIVAEASTATAAVEMAGLYQPDLVLLDVFMPGVTGLEALPRIAAAAPGALIVLLTAATDPAVLRAGGADTVVIDKACDLDDLVRLLGGLTGAVQPPAAPRVTTVPSAAAIQ